jgi:hypothetical protein
VATDATRRWIRQRCGTQIEDAVRLTEDSPSPEPHGTPADLSAGDAGGDR